MKATKMLLTKKVKANFKRNHPEVKFKKIKFIEDRFTYDSKGTLVNVSFTYGDSNVVFEIHQTAFRQAKLTQQILFYIYNQKQRIKNFVLTDKVVKRFEDQKNILSLKNIEIVNVSFDTPKRGYSISYKDITIYCKKTRKEYTYTEKQFSSAKVTKEHRIELMKAGQLDEIKIAEILKLAQKNGRPIEGIKITALLVKNNNFTHVEYIENGDKYRQDISDFSNGYIPERKLHEAKNFTYILAGVNTVTGKKAIKIGSSNDYERRTSGEIDNAYTFKTEYPLCVLRDGTHEGLLAYFLTTTAIKEGKQHLSGVENKSKKSISSEFYNYENTFNDIVKYLEDNKVDFVLNNI